MFEYYKSNIMLKLLMSSMNLWYHTLENIVPLSVSYGFCQL